MGLLSSSLKYHKSEPSLFCMCMGVYTYIYICMYIYLILAVSSTKLLNSNPVTLRQSRRLRSLGVDLALPAAWPENFERPLGHTSATLNGTPLTHFHMSTHISTYTSPCIIFMYIFCTYTYIYIYMIRQGRWQLVHSLEADSVPGFLLHLLN